MSYVHIFHQYPAKALFCGPCIHIKNLHAFEKKMSQTLDFRFQIIFPENCMITLGSLFATAIGGIKGGCMHPHFLPVRRKKLSKLAIFGKFLDFCPLRNTFCPLDAPHKKFLVLPLATACVLGISLLNV